MQPADWPDIVPYFEFYTKSDFCFPIKYIVDNQISGIGTTIVHGETAWLAHIIVHPEQRNKGVGTKITEALVNSLKNTGCKTILLIATKLGEPVYKKLGFTKETEYLYLREGKTLLRSSDSIKIFEESYLPELLNLDRIVSGENRIKVITPHLRNSYTIVNNKKLEGYYLPTLGEGLIISRTKEAGLELLNLKHATVERAAMPGENQIASDFLLAHGFREVARGTRMVLGKKINWQPAQIYGRIGGNLG